MSFSLCRVLLARTATSVPRAVGAAGEQPAAVQGLRSAAASAALGLAWGLRRRFGAHEDRGQGCDVLLHAAHGLGALLHEGLREVQALREALQPQEAEALELVLLRLRGPDLEAQEVQVRAPGRALQLREGRIEVRKGHLALGTDVGEHVQEALRVADVQAPLLEEGLEPWIEDMLLQLLDLQGTIAVRVELAAQILEGLQVLRPLLPVQGALVLKVRGGQVAHLVDKDGREDVRDHDDEEYNKADQPDVHRSTHLREDVEVMPPCLAPGDHLEEAQDALLYRAKVTHDLVYLVFGQLAGRHLLEDVRQGLHDQDCEQGEHEDEEHKGPEQRAHAVHQTVQHEPQGLDALEHPQHPEGLAKPE
mmetsp:Transcript_40931/g.130065  ORF Transcript_40931/g.130065 Transcript_40931/m.130065 type:complete len:363 (+) Transcript_40931:69-1157(+)